MPGIVIGAITGGVELSVMRESRQGHWLTWVMILVGLVLTIGIGITIWPYIPWPAAPGEPPPASLPVQTQRYRITPPAPPPRVAAATPTAAPKEPPPPPAPARKTVPIPQRRPIAKKSRSKDSIPPNRRFGVIAYPAARVLDEPDYGDMIGRVNPGQRVEILGERHVPGSVVDPVWYRIDFHGTAGWISRLSLTHPPVADTSPVPSSRASGQKEPSRTAVIANMINDYRGKILRVDFLDDTECRVQVDKSMSVEDARQTSENIGYYIVNATGKTPRVIVSIERLQIAVATSDGGRYIGAIDIREQGTP